MTEQFEKDIKNTWRLSFLSYIDAIPIETGSWGGTYQKALVGAVYVVLTCGHNCEILAKFQTKQLSVVQCAESVSLNCDIFYHNCTVV